MANGVTAKKVLDIHIGGNTGNLKTKIKGEYSLDIFEGICKGPVPDSLDVDKNDKFIKINGDNYIIGEGVTNSGSIRNRDIKEIKALLLCGIMRQAKKEKNIDEYGKINVSLCVGLPIEEYTRNNKSNVEYLENQLAGERFDVVFMGTSMEVQFTKVKVMPEGYCWYFVNKDKLGSHDTAVIVDIGSRTIDLCFVKDGKPYYPISHPFGTTLSLYKDIRFAILQKYEGEDEKPKVTDEQISKLLESGSVRIGKDVYSKNDYEDIIEKYWEQLDRIITATDGYSDYKAAHEVVILGGGKHLVYKYAKDKLKIPNVPDIANAEYANAEAYYVWAHKK